MSCTQSYKRVLDRAAELEAVFQTPSVDCFRAIKTGICSPRWRQNNSNKTKWPMSKRLNRPSPTLVCETTYIWTEMTPIITWQFLYRFDKMVVKVADTKTVADSLWQGYNVSQSFSYFSETAKIFWDCPCGKNSAWTLCSDASDSLLSLSTEINHGIKAKDDMLNFLPTWKTHKYAWNVNVLCTQYTDELTPHVEWLEDKKTLANRWIAFLPSISPFFWLISIFC